MTVVGDATINVSIDTTHIQKVITETTQKLASSFKGIAGGIATFGTLILKAGAAALAMGPLVGAIGGVVAATANLAGGAAALGPAFILAGGAILGTFKLAMAGFATAGGAAGQVRGALDGLKRSWDDLHASVQNRMFENLAGPVKALGNAYIPILKTGLTGISGEFNTAAKSALAFLQSAQSQKDTGTGLENTRLGLKGVLSGLTPVIQAFRDMAVVGSGFLPAIGTEVGNLGTKFGAFIARVRDSGQLQVFIQHAIDTFKALGHIVSDVVTILKDVFNSAKIGGNGFLATVTTIADNLVALLANPDVKAGLSSFFALSQAAAATLLGALGTALPELLKALAPLFTTLAQVVSGVLGKAIEALVPVIVELAPVIGTLATLLGGILTTAIEFLGPLFLSLVPVVEEVGKIVAEVLMKAVEALGPILQSLVPIIIPLAKVMGEIFVTAIGILSQVLTALVPVLEPFGKLFLDVFGVVSPVFAQLGKVFEALMPPIVELITNLLPVMTNLWDAVTPVIGILVDSILPPLVTIIQEVGRVLVQLSPFIQVLAEQILPGLAGAFGQVLAQVLTLASIVLPPLLAVLVAVSTALTDMPVLIYILVGAYVAWKVATLFNTAVQWLSTAALNGSRIAMIAATVATNIQAAAIWVLNGAMAVLTSPIGIIIAIIAVLVIAFITLWKHSEGFRNFFIGMWAKIKEVVGAVVDWLVVAFHNTIDWIVNAWGNVLNFFVFLWNTISAATVTAWNAVAGFFVSVWSAITGAIVTAWNAIGAFFTFLWVTISGAIVTAWTAVVDFFTGLWATITGAIVAAWNFVVDILTSTWAWISNIIFVAGQGIRAFLGGLWDLILAAAHAVWDTFQAIIITPLQAAWNWVTGVFGGIAGWFSGLWSGIVGTARTLWAGITGAITGPVQSAWTTVTSVLGGAASWFSGIWNAVISTTGNILGGIGSAVTTAFGDLVSLLKKPVNAVIDSINWVIDKLNGISFTVPSWVPGIGGNTVGVNISHIPRLAQGALIQPTPNGTLALLAEAGRPERVSPVDSEGFSGRERALINATREKGDTVVHVFIGQQELAALVDARIQVNNNRLAANLASGRKLVSA